ncbi:hypothetical protein BTJ68_01401 [Hortaea werneckii EXF-2000]|uniref:C2H2-type domain-containing protein n=1 Tax=Hortaea werneckii EXF-2000 TaxID=1157616 RepID=A0A1Z5TS95_HORWE|nr:hypothetical protein BTJ68_01401 [Hortaea werneckii EXF-2000]
MATFSEYQQPIMTSDNDFTLYSYPETWNDPSFLMPAYADQSYASATTYDNFTVQQAYAQPDQKHSMFTQSYQSAQNHLRPQSPNYSPSNSASHSLDYQNAPILSSTSDSGASAQSTISSTMGSPSAQAAASNDWQQRASMSMVQPSIVQQENVGQDFFAPTGFDVDMIPIANKGCVDPSLIQPTSPSQLAGTHMHESQPMQPHEQMMYPHPPSPRPAVHSPSFGKAPSPYMRQHAWQPYPAYPGSRRQSISSIHSRHSQGSISSDDSNKGLCPIPTCGRHVKDLKAHMLTHQNERPEKCPIPTCEYHIKGFARKYDKNRHTLTHYKGTMVCGFCPGSGSAAEKSFNRADVFKRHLTSVHGVEQTPPNARRKSPTSTTRKAFGVQDISGMCSTCGNTFANAQDFYEHLDDCVLRVVQQADPSEAINEKLLSSVAEDQQVQDTMDRHMLPNTVDFNASNSFYEEEEAEDEEDGDFDDANDGTYGNRSSKSGRGSLKSRKAGAGNSRQHVGGGTSHVFSGGAVSKPSAAAQRKGMTLSKNGVPLAGAMNGKGSKRRKNYPLSWGAAPEKMKMKKRVLCVFDGSRRLWKDDMMLDADHEVRIPLPGVGDGRAWVTDLDVATLQRAEGLHNATEEEKGPWDPNQLLQ